MTRKDFELIASVVQDITPKAQRVKIAMTFADRLSDENSRFDMGRFLKACMPPK